MKRRDFLITTAGAAGSILPGLGFAQGRPCPPSPLSVAGGGSVNTGCTPVNAEADWIARSTGAGVVWAHDFRSPEEVDNFVYWSGSATRRDVWLTGDQRSTVPGPYQVPSDIRSMYPEGDGIAGTGGGSLNCHLPVGLACQGSWARPFSPFRAGSVPTNGNGRTNDDPAAGGAVPMQSWDAYTSSRDRIRHWRGSHYAHPDNWRLPNGQPDPIRAEASGFHREGDEFWLQFRYKVPAARFGPKEPEGKMLIINPTSSGSQLADSTVGQIVPESNRDGRVFAFLNRKALNFGDLTEPQGAIGTSWIKTPGGDHAATCGSGSGRSLSAADCGLATNSLIVPDEWMTVMIHVKVGRPAWWGIPVTKYPPKSGSDDNAWDDATKQRYVNAGILYPGRSIDLRPSTGCVQLIEAAGNNNSTFEMFVARKDATRWTTVYSKRDYIFSWGQDYRTNSDGQIVQATSSARGFSAAFFSAYMNAGTVGTGAVDAPWYQRFTQVIFARQPIPLPAVGA